MHKKIAAALLLGTMIMTCAGCKDSDQKDVQNASVQESSVETDDTVPDESKEEVLDAETNEEATDAGEQSEEMKQEQEAGAAQIEADAIDLMHEEKEIPAESVEQAAFSEKKLMLDESGNWIRLTSGTGEDGSYGETYAYDEGLEYSWNYTAAEKADAQSGLAEAVTGRNWTMADSSREDALSDQLGREVYRYTAYEDDNGYSMLHEGLYLDIEGGYYIADFSMMEGSMGDYYDTVQTLLSQIYIEG